MGVEVLGVETVYRVVIVVRYCCMHVHCMMGNMLLLLCGYFMSSPCASTCIH